MKLKFKPHDKVTSIKGRGRCVYKYLDWTTGNRSIKGGKNKDKYAVLRMLRNSYGENVADECRIYFLKMDNLVRYSDSKETTTSA